MSKFSKWGLNLSDEQVAGPVTNVCCVCLCRAYGQVTGGVLWRAIMIRISD